MVKYTKERSGTGLVAELSVLTSTIDHFGKTAEFPHGPGPEPGALPGGEEILGFKLLKNGKILQDLGKILGALE